MLFDGVKKKIKEIYFGNSKKVKNPFRNCKNNLEIYPDNNNIFNCFNFCEIDEIKVVIIGQDPYHGPGQATGLSFAINENITIPPSLRNIKNELFIIQF